MNILKTIRVFVSYYFLNTAVPTGFSGKIIQTNWAEIYLKTGIEIGCEFLTRV